MVPRHHVIGRALDDLFEARGAERFMRQIAEADAVAVPQETGMFGRFLSNGSDRLVRAGRGHEISFREKGRLERFLSAFPFGELEAGAEFGFGFVDRMGKEARHERGSGSAFNELRGAREQAQHDAH